MSRRRKVEDDGRSLFDEPLELPTYPQEELTNTDTFVLDAKETTGLIMKINKRLIEKVAGGDSPNYSLSKYLNDMTRNINLSVASYAKLLEIENAKNEIDEDPELTFTT